MKRRTNSLKVVLPGLVVLAVLLLLIARQDGGQEGVQNGSQDGGQDDVTVNIQQLELPALSDADFNWIAARIYQNEAMGQARYLTHWGTGEDFPSFGIGHFIWFPAGVDAPFDEMFPDMVEFVRQRSANDLPLPEWMRDLEPFDAPWTDKVQFDEAWSSAEMTALRDWLEATAQYQARFIVSSFEQRWRELEIEPERKRRFTKLLQELAGTAQGLFAIIDYYNFKGLGVNPRERYQGEGWGLIQVLEGVEQLREEGEGCKDLVELFSQSAADRMRLRVELSPPERGEKRWLEGWLKRLQGYIEDDIFSGPGFRVRPYLQNPDKHAVTLTWLSNDQRPGQAVAWKQGTERAENGQLIKSQPARADALEYHPAEPRRTAGCPMPAVPFLHEVRLTDLEAGASYHYRVTQQEDNAEGVFRTPPINEEPLRFIVYGDSETEPESTGKHASWPGEGEIIQYRRYPVDQTTGYAENLKVIQRQNPAFVAIAGDLVQSGGEQRDWDEFWSQNSELAASTFIIPALGNHEYFGGPGVLGRYAIEDSERAIRKYRTYFDLPDNGSSTEAHKERYYALDYGVVTLIVLDTTDSPPHRSDSDTNWALSGEADGGFAPDWQPGSEQYRWLKNELQHAQEQSRFTFVMFHGAPYSSGVHGQPPGNDSGQDILSAQPLQALTPLFIELGVDAVFNGHDEMYEHSVVPGFEILPGGAKRDHEIHFYDIGIGGDGLRGPVDGVLNPHRVFLAHSDAPEVRDPHGLLLEGGKHYGHIEVNVEKNPDGLWQAQLDAVHVFPVMDTNGHVLEFERRFYEDSVTLITD